MYHTNGEDGLQRQVGNGRPGLLDDLAETDMRWLVGVSASAALSGQGRLLFRLFDKRICSGEVIYFLDQMLQFHKGRHLVVVMDQAPPHTSQMTTAYIERQHRLHVFYLPKYSPDWNPDEKVWNHLKQ